MKRVNILVGRFQPFTAGHYKCVEAAWHRKRIPTVICMMDVPESKVDLRHPFPSDMLIDLYSDLFNNDSKVADVVKVKNADIVVIGEQLRNLGYEIASWTCGTDRFNGYDKQANKYHDLAGLSDDYETIEVVRDESSADNISATKVRESLLNNDRISFNKMMPPGSLSNKDFMFDVLKEQIDKVYNKSEHLLLRRIVRLENIIRHIYK